MNKEEDPNIIELLKQALLFYSNESNYYTPSEGKSLVIMDNGHQAKFALQKVDEFNELIDNINNDYDNLTNNIKTEESPDNILKIIDDLKNVENGD